jgi:hypothetical protein
MASKRIYAVKGTRWQQSALEYGDLVATMEITKGYFTGFVGSTEAFGTLLDRLVADNVIPKLFRVILKPHAPTRWHARWNAWQARRHGVNLEDVARSMTLEEIGRVMLDFFSFNVSSILRSLASLTQSSTTQTGTEPIISALLKLFTAPAVATSPGRPPSQNSTGSSSASGS